MKRLLYVLAICAAGLLFAAPAQADGIHFLYASIATGVDEGPQEGIFEHFTTGNLGSVNNNGYTSMRTAFEFDLSAAPAASQIASVTLTTEIKNGEGTRSIEIHGYSGDGTVQLADLTRDRLVSTASVGPSGRQYLTYDVTGFVTELLASGGTFVGFNVREEPANEANYIVMWLGTIYLTVNVDTTPPTIAASATKADAGVYTGGTWTNQTVTVHFACSDDGSGVASCPPDVTYDAEGTFTATGTATDKAGNSSTVTFSPIRIDLTAPTGSVSIAPSEQAGGTVLVHVKAADNLSGVDSMILTRTPELAGGSWETYAETRSWTLGPSNTVYIHFRDNAGNVSLAYSAGIYPIYLPLLER